MQLRFDPRIILRRFGLQVAEATFYSENAGRAEPRKSAYIVRPGTSYDLKTGVSMKEAARP